jgi:hypothetical protein
MPALFLAIAGVMYLCVPETDHFPGVALLVLGVGLLEFVSAAALPLGWHALVLSTVLVAGMWGAQWRDSAVVGAVFAGWVITLPALTSLVWRSAPTWARWATTSVAVATAVVVSRTGALGARMWPALIWACGATAVSGLSVLVLRAGTPARHRQ